MNPTDQMIEFVFLGLSVIGFYILIGVCLIGYKRICRLALYVYTRWLR